MWKYVLKRNILVFFTAFITLSLTYILLSCLPVVKPQYSSEGQLIAYLENQYRLGFLLRFESEQHNSLVFFQSCNIGTSTYYYYLKPVMDRYFDFLGRVFTNWDWGYSTQLKLGTAAMDLIMERLPVSIRINIISTFISVPLGIIVGIIAALNKDKPIDHVINVLIMVSISIPGFVTITYLILWFAYGTHWLPYRWPEVISDATTITKGYIIPVVSLTFGTVAGFARYVRAELCEVMSSEYLLLARTKGLTRRQAIIHHALRNSMVPVVPMIVAEFFSILGGSIILEQIYNIQGIGSLYMTAFTTKDYNVLMCDMAFYTIIGLAANILVDLSYGFIDPRIRMGER